MNKTYHISPLKQGILILILFSATIMYLWVAVPTIQEAQELRSYLFACSFLLFYIIMNSFFSFGAANRMTYYQHSIFTYLGLLILFVIICQIISTVKLNEAKSYAWLFYVFSLVYLVFMTIISLIRKIVDIAIKQDNNLNNEL